MSLEKWGWASVTLTAGTVIALFSFLFVYANGLDSGQNQAVAAWVQAVGSIGAIVGAFLVGQMQARAAVKQAFDVAERESKARIEAIGAVVGIAYVQAVTVATSIAEKTPAEALQYWQLHAKAEVQSAVATMDVLPFHEIGNVLRVQGAMGVRSSLLRIAADMLHFETAYAGLSPSALRSLQGKVAAEKEQADRNWTHFKTH